MSLTITYLQDQSLRRPFPSGWQFNSIEQFVLFHGQRFNRIALPKGIRHGETGRCFQNAIRLVKARGLRYVEGYARWRDDMPYPFLHGWCADLDGNAYDPTWPEGTDYFGVAIELSYAIRRRRVSGWQSVLDSPSDFPIVSGREENWRALPLSGATGQAAA
jgi:hypothetical protein